jgi:hypothetical protein
MFARFLKRGKSPEILALSALGVIDLPPVSHRYKASALVSVRAK